MLEAARREGKGYIHLGLGVNEGIRRFKEKWGGRPALPYVMAGWREGGVSGSSREAMEGFVRLILQSPSGLSKRQIFESLPQQRPFAMLWELTKGGGGPRGSAARPISSAVPLKWPSAISSSGWTPCFSRGRSTRRRSTRWSRWAKRPDGRHPPLTEVLSEAEIRRLERVVRGPTGRLARLLNAAVPHPADVRGLLADTRHWYAFFSLWAAYLERRGWSQSVDLCAWNTAMDMGKTVIGMESLEEQVASLEAIPLSRVVSFLRDCGDWNAYMRRNMRAYLSGSLNRMLGTTTEFPPRTTRIIDGRNQRFRERMRPFIEEGRTAVFVGSAHMLQLREMLGGRRLHRASGPPHMAAPAACPAYRRKRCPLPDWPRLSAEAVVPEHLVAYVRAVSDMEPLRCGGFLAYRGGSALVLVGARARAGTCGFRRPS